jgi:hypothetical protein
MKLEFIIFGITGLLIYNTYYDYKYSKFFIGYKKYIQMATIALFGLSVYLILKRNPSQSKNLLLYANNAVKYMPINKQSMDMISPIFDFTSRQAGFMEEANQDLNPGHWFNNILPGNNNASERRLLQPGKSTKRSVSETKKKYVASNQDWKCGECKSRLNAWFEVDHKVRLEHGGSNDVSNLVALCRECHGKKTAMENM